MIHQTTFLVVNCIYLLELTKVSKLLLIDMRMDCTKLLCAYVALTFFVNLYESYPTDRDRPSSSDVVVNIGITATPATLSKHELESVSMTAL